MLLDAFAILSGLAAAAFAVFATRPFTAAVLAGAFSAAALVFSEAHLPNPSWASALIASAAGTVLWKPHWSIVAAGAGGLAAALWAELLVAQGLPGSVVFPAIAAIVAAGAVLAAARRSFAPAILREEALLIVAAFALIVAAAPSVIDGFGTAVAFTAARLPDKAGPPAPWALAVAAGCAVLGAIRSLWKTR